MERHFDALTLNHNNDPTGQQGEDVPLWFNVFCRYKEYCDQNNASNQAREQRGNLRNVQAALGAVQPPLGAGNPPTRSEIAAENPQQLAGPEELGAEMEVNAVLDNDDTATAQVPNRRRRNRGGGNRRRNRPRPGGRTVQDDIDDGREQLGQLAASLSEMTRSLTPVPAPVAHPLTQDPVASLRMMTESVQSLATNLDSPQAREIQARALHSWNGLFDQFDHHNGIPPFAGEEN